MEVDAMAADTMLDAIGIRTEQYDLRLLADRQTCPFSVLSQAYTVESGRHYSSKLVSLSDSIPQFINAGWDSDGPEL